MPLTARLTQNLWYREHCTYPTVQTEAEDSSVITKSPPLGHFLSQFDPGQINIYLVSNLVFIFIYEYVLNSEVVSYNKQRSPPNSTLCTHFVYLHAFYRWHWSKQSLFWHVNNTRWRMRNNGATCANFCIILLIYFRPKQYIYSRQHFVLKYTTHSYLRMRYSVSRRGTISQDKMLGDPCRLHAKATFVRRAIPR
jgi:hypothetical protein